MEMVENGNLIGSINGTVVGGAELVTGKLGLALHTNGVDQYVDFGYQGNTCLGSISMYAHGWVTAFWVQFANDRTGSIIDTGLYGYERVGIILKAFILMVRISLPGKSWYVSTRLPSQPVWIHIVVTWQMCHGVKLYVDGALAAENSSPTSDPDTFKLYSDMSRFVLGAFNTYQVKLGMTLDELRIWDTVMTAEEVLSLYTADTGLN